MDQDYKILNLNLIFLTRVMNVSLELIERIGKGSDEEGVTFPQ